ncbi:MAG: CoA ester lyase [Gammaproteobacteria bacterium]
MKRSRASYSGLRSFLFVPGNHPRKVEKVFTVGADAIILDLEDAVAITEKPATRQVVVAALQPARQCRGYIRINAIDTPFWRDDLSSVIGSHLDGIVLPKVESAETLLEVDALITGREQALGIDPGSIDLMPIVETARGVENSMSIATACPRVRRLSFGGGDYTLDLDYRWEADEQVLAYARAKLSHASRIAQLEPPIDTVVLQIREHDRFTASAERGRAFGFGGKLCIHPDQVALTHTVFSPSDEEVAHARAVIDAFERAEAEGSASIQLNGYFIDYPIVDKARRIVALTERLSAASTERNSP